MELHALQADAESISRAYARIHDIDLAAAMHTTWGQWRHLVIEEDRA